MESQETVNTKESLDSVVSASPQVNNSPTDRQNRRSSFRKEFLAVALRGIVAMLVILLMSAAISVLYDGKVNTSMELSSVSVNLNVMHAEVKQVTKYQLAAANDLEAGRSPQESQANSETAAQKVTEYLDEFKKLSQSSQIDAQIDKVGALQSENIKIGKDIVNQLQADKDRDVSGLKAALLENLDSSEREISTLGDLLHKERADAQETAVSTTWLTVLSQLVMVVIIAVLVVILTARLRKRMSASTDSMQHALQAMAKRDLTVTAVSHTDDEISDMVNSLNASQIRLREIFGKAHQTAVTVAQQASYVESRTSKAAQVVGEKNLQAHAVGGAAEQVSFNVQTVAAGAEEMGSAIREISSNAIEAAKVAQEATKIADSTRKTVEELSVSSREIDDVVRTITEIAGQTNLLALNATIEAARAGDSGKGFAVVAGEVKDLASETAKDAEEITHKIQKIQADTESAVEAIRRISEIVNEINDYQTTIAAAVEEQTTVTNDMSRSISEAATGSSDIAAKINEYAESAANAQQPIQELANTSLRMKQAGEGLKSQLEQFKYE
ncbi:methyl-accepting chemotaxis protein signaling domain protein [Mobiluncus holmesii ATCC 35242]|uniref:Methyl-accepting chemotaxis protein signaling domain protein n=1 Tax=Mobiluncus holmesii ATCC 35242 TaxID=887899 RepID=E6M3Q9_9ACTO|nr:methyl-accepting chemotaxis protein [Mobiluncus holmesii]EFU81964.1 methyl-accepting chemotaxis protein signaling domain protein [Mobiluncus holmesii ATCC 35242]STY88471.1 Methyl-accepting chemotaxis protein 4 [Mobiluncus holmesii]